MWEAGSKNEVKHVGRSDDVIIIIIVVVVSNFYYTDYYENARALQLSMVFVSYVVVGWAFDSLKALALGCQLIKTVPLQL